MQAISGTNSVYTQETKPLDFDKKKSSDLILTRVKLLALSSLAFLVIALTLPYPPLFLCATLATVLLSFVGIVALRQLSHLKPPHQEQKSSSDIKPSEPLSNIEKSVSVEKESELKIEQTPIPKVEYPFYESICFEDKWYSKLRFSSEIILNCLKKTFTEDSALLEEKVTAIESWFQGIINNQSYHVDYNGTISPSISYVEIKHSPRRESLEVILNFQCNKYGYCHWFVLNYKNDLEAEFLKVPTKIVFDYESDFTVNEQAFKKDFEEKRDNFICEYQEEWEKANMLERIKALHERELHKVTSSSDDPPAS